MRKGRGREGQGTQLVERASVSQNAGAIMQAQRYWMKRQLVSPHWSLVLRTHTQINFIVSSPDPCYPPPPPMTSLTHVNAECTINQSIKT
jgi:hypothetical protein